MEICKEKMPLCRPLTCHDATCDFGNQLRGLREKPRCGAEICTWMQQGINGINSCKDANCPIEVIIVNLKK